jgi:hypothetical protein
MGVRIDQSGHQHASGRVDFDDAINPRRSVAADASDAFALDTHPGVRPRVTPGAIDQCAIVNEQ